MNDNRHVAHTDNSEIEGTSLHEASLEEDEELVEPNTVEQTQTAVEQPSDQKRPRDDDDAIVEAGDEALAKRQANSNVRAVPRVKNEPWDVMFERLRIYKQIHGDCVVPKRYAPDPKLGTWVETQRIQYKKLERRGDDGEYVKPNNRLTQERLDSLQSIGFAWNAKDRPKPSFDEQSLRFYDKYWDDFYLQLAKYKEKHGDTLVLKKQQYYLELAKWCETQRWLWGQEYPSELEAHDAAEAMDNSTDDVDMTDAAVEDEASGDDSLEMRNEDLPEFSAFGRPTAAAQPEGLLTRIFPHGSCSREGSASLQAEKSALSAPEKDHLSESTTEAISTRCATAEGVAALTVSRGAPADRTNDAIALMAAKPAAAANAAEVSMDGDSDTKPAPKYLTQARKAKLDDLGFVWRIQPRRLIVNVWDDMFQKLVEYKEKNGDCLVPSRYKENTKLAKWVETQRYEYRKMQRTSAPTPAQENLECEELGASKSNTANPRLTEEQIRRLESIGFEWNVKNKMKRYFDKQWEQMLERLTKFKAEYGHCTVPKRYPPDPKLGTWVHTQGCQYRQMTYRSKSAIADEHLPDSGTEEEEGTLLTSDRRKRLSELGFVWPIYEAAKLPEPVVQIIPIIPARITRNSYDDLWDAMFESLAAYKEKYGHCLVPKRYKEDPKLGTWVDTQRVQCKKMKKKLEAQDPHGPEAADSGKPILQRFTDERIRRLENLGFVWSIRDDWQKHYEELKDYKNDNGNCNVPARYAKNRRLGIWVSAQRQQYKILKADSTQGRSAALTQQRIDLLNDLGFTWAVRSRDTLGESWSQRLLELQEYKKQHGDCLVPVRYQPNPELGVWVGTQRTQYRLNMKAKEESKPTPIMTSKTTERIQQLTELGFVFALRGHDGKNDSSEPDSQAEAIEQEALRVAGEIASGSEPVTESGVASSNDADSTFAVPGVLDESMLLTIQHAAI